MVSPMYAATRNRSVSPASGRTFRATGVNRSLLPTVLIVLTYIAACLWLRTRPWKYFQLNARWFNEAEGVFSKQELNDLFPRKWMLRQWEERGCGIPGAYPVYVKPIWGENARGIHCVKNPAEFVAVRKIVAASKTPYLVQEAAAERCEFELFSISDPQDPERAAVLSVTEVRNAGEEHPVNSIYNPATTYHDITELLSARERSAIWALLAEVGRFPISRLCVRAESVQDLVAGRFHIVELNLYTPMPIHLLDARYSGLDRWKIIRRCAVALARLTRDRDRQAAEKPVFTRTTFHGGGQPLFRRMIGTWLR